MKNYLLANLLVQFVQGDESVIGTIRALNNSHFKGMGGIAGNIDDIIEEYDKEYWDPPVLSEALSKEQLKLAKDVGVYSEDIDELVQNTLELKKELNKGASALNITKKDYNLLKELARVILKYKETVDKYINTYINKRKAYINNTYTIPGKEALIAFLLNNRKNNKAIMNMANKLGYQEMIEVANTNVKTIAQ